MRCKTLFLVASVVATAAASVAAYAKENEGLDRKIDYSDTGRFGVSCAKALAEMKSANPREYGQLEKAGLAVFDTSQPEGQLAFRSAAGQVCQSLWTTAEQSGGTSASFRDLYIRNIAEAIAEKERAGKSYDSLIERSGGLGAANEAIGNMRAASAEKLSGYQEALRVLQRNR